MTVGRGNDGEGCGNDGGSGADVSPRLRAMKARASVARGGRLCPPCPPLTAPRPGVGGEVDAAGLGYGDVGVDLRGDRAGVAQQVLHDAEVLPPCSYKGRAVSELQPGASSWDCASSLM